MSRDRLNLTGLPEAEHDDLGLRRVGCLRVGGRGRYVTGGGLDRRLLAGDRPRYEESDGGDAGHQMREFMSVPPGLCALGGGW